MKKANIFLEIAAVILLLAGCVSAASEELVYLKINDAATSSFDDTPDWAPPPSATAPVDGDTTTRWASKYGMDNQWISFDFGDKKNVTLIKILWENAYATEYEIQASDDGKEWKTVKLLQEQAGGTAEINLEQPAAARYIRILGLKRANPEWGISVWEVEFWGPKDLNPADKPIEEVLPGHKTFTEELKEAASAKLEDPLPGLGLMTPKEFQAGVVYTSWGRDELGTKASDNTLEYLYAKGIRHVAIMVPWFQDTVESKTIWPDLQKDTPTDMALAHAINTCHKLGMKVMIKPHVDTKDGAWRGDIVPSDEWFVSYEDFIVQYAKFAAKYNTEAYCVGTELANTTMPVYQKQWNQIIDKVKEHYKGPLIYAANWNEYDYVSFWDRVEFIGIDAYFPLTSKKSPTLGEIQTAWISISDKIEKWLKKENITKPVVFTEIGYSSAAGTNIEPWRSFTVPKATVDEQEQANCVIAICSIPSNKDWFKGMYWWQYFPQERYNPAGFIIRGKEAENTLSQCYIGKISAEKETTK